MRLSEDRILTTHAGSLPRPDDVAAMMYDIIDEKEVDYPAIDARVRRAIADVVARQREVGIDFVSDGEMGKVGFSNYVIQRMSGFAGEAQFMAADIGDAPEIIPEVFGGEGGEHLRLPILAEKLTPRDPESIGREIADLQAALDGEDADEAFISSVTPGQVAFNFPNRAYGSHQEYIEAAAEMLRPEYEAVVRAGFNLQLDSPDSAMAFHCSTEGSDLHDPAGHLAASIEVLNDTLSDIPPEKLRYHVCWGNYRGPHHHDVAVEDILEAVLRTRAKFIYIEGANPRHEHEWEVWRDTPLPDDKALIVGVIDTKTNHVEHPRLVAQRIERYAELVGRERVIAGTDCGFATFVGWHSCNPTAAWMKLGALVEGAALASQRLW